MKLTSFNKDLAPPIPSIPTVESIHNPQMSRVIKQTNQNLQTGGNLHQRLGRALKDMAKGEINPIQLYGDTLNIIGNFMNGIPAGMHQARLKKISSQMKLVVQKKTAIERKMSLVGDDLMASSTINTVTTAEATAPELKTSPAPVIAQTTPESKSEPEAKTNPVSIPTSAPTQSSPGPMTEAIDKLLKSNASMDEKLDAIEKTLDEMLEQLIKIEQNLEAIQATLEANSPTQESQGMVVETEAKTEVEVVANDPEAEVATRTEIDTDIVAEARSKTETDREVEVPEVTVDSVLDESEPDIGQELAQIVSSYEGNLDKLNQHLQQDKLHINISDGGSFLSISEINKDVASPVFYAAADGESWQVKSNVNDDRKLEIIESFVEAEAAALAEPESEPEQTVRVPVTEELSL